MTPGIFCPTSTNAPASVVFMTFPLNFVFGSSAGIGAISGVVILFSYIYIRGIMPNIDYICQTSMRQCEMCTFLNGFLDQAVETIKAR
jgi:hypothetical protein